jgi:hypothetical protein
MDRSRHDEDVVAQPAPLNPEKTNEKRQGPDRREKPTRPISRYTFVGRRVNARRTDESDNYYVDRYDPRLLIIIGLCAVFCVGDFYLTKHILQAGGSELNPLMAYLIEKNMLIVEIIKYLVTFVALIFLLFHKNFRLLRAIKVHLIIYLIFVIYLATLIFEIYSYIKITSV